MSTSPISYRSALESGGTKCDVGGVRTDKTRRLAVTAQRACTNLRHLLDIRLYSLALLSVEDAAP